LTYAACGLCALALVGAPRTAHAQDPSPADRATARTLAQEGYDALRAERYAVAVDRFKRADALVHAPTLLRDLARAQVGLGHLVEARETYARVLRDRVPPKSPASWSQAVEESKRDLAALETRVPWLTLNITGPLHPHVTLDGESVLESSLGTKQATDPGRHELRASGEGYIEATKVVELREGEALSVAVELERAPVEPPPKKVEAVAPPPPVTRLKEASWRKPAMISAFAIGGAGIVVGSVTGILAMTKHSELVSGCPDRTCGRDEESNYNDFHTLGTVSTVGFIAGGAGLATGVVLLLVKPKTSVETPAPGQASRGATWSPFIGVGAAGVRGSF
jgi:hypothetical protein